MRFREAIDGFLISFLADGHSASTASGYRYYLETLDDYLGHPALEAVTPADIAKYAAWLRNGYAPKRRGGDASPYAPATVNKAWCATRSFYNWASDTLNISRPDMGWQQPRWDPPQVQPFSQAEVAALLKAAEYSAQAKTERRTPFRMKRPTGLRDVALITLLLDTGLRVSEAARLRVQDVALETGEVYVVPYGSGRKTKSRNVYLGRATIKALWRYLATREDRRGDDPLFLTRDSRPMDRINLRLVLSRLGERCGINCYPHRFRHTFAVQYLRNGGDVFTLQRLLGHSTLEMVRRYLALADDDAARAHRTASPVDRWRL